MKNLNNIKILIVNGPNLNMLGIREPQIYGTTTYPQLESMLQDFCQKQNLQCEIFQSNHEGEIIDKIQSAYNNFDGIIINPAAYTHTSIGILDALKSVNLPAVEVHISDPTEREDFRHISYAGMACFATVRGMGIEGYNTAIKKLKDKIMQD